jgi:hypothetical protein
MHFAHTEKERERCFFTTYNLQGYFCKGIKELWTMYSVDNQLQRKFLCFLLDCLVKLRLKYYDFTTWCTVCPSNFDRCLRENLPERGKKKSWWNLHYMLQLMEWIERKQYPSVWLFTFCSKNIVTRNPVGSTWWNINKKWSNIWLLENTIMYRCKAKVKLSPLLN